MPTTTFTIEIEQEDDGRWLCEIPQLSGVLTYGATKDEAIAKAEALALRVLADGDVVAGIGDAGRPGSTIPATGAEA